MGESNFLRKLYDYDKDNIRSANRTTFVKTQADDATTDLFSVDNNDDDDADDVDNEEDEDNDHDDDREYDNDNDNNNDFSLFLTQTRL